MGRGALNRNQPRRTDGLSVVHVVSSEGFAGVERYLLYTTAELAARGHRVTVIGGSLPALGPRLHEAGVEHHPAASPWAVARALVRRRGRDDVVHAHMSEAELAAVAVKPLCRRPIVATLHFARARGGAGRRARLLGLLAHGIDLQIAISDVVAHASGQDCIVIPSGVPATVAPAGHRERVVLVAQRLEPEKRTDLALEVWAASGLASAGWALHLAGGGSEETRLRARAAQLGVDASVTFLGFVDDLQARMASASVLLAPSPVDGLGLSVVEAMGAALPVVAARGGGHLETVGPVSDDYLFDAADAAAGAAALRRIALAPDVGRDYGQRLRARFEAMYTVERHAARLEDAYFDVLDRTGRRPGHRR